MHSNGNWMNDDQRSAVKSAAAEAYKTRLKDLVLAAVRLAIVRNDLATDDNPTIGDDEADAIGRDTWKALNGDGTCDYKVADELAVLLDA